MDKNIKENDWLLNSLYNPSFTNSDFKAVGINADNTSLLDKETYKNSATIKNNPLLQTDGKFDEAKFDIVYNNVLDSYNKLASDTYNTDVMANATFFRDNIFAPVEKRVQGPQIELTQVINPYRQTKGLIDIDRWGPRLKTEMELAESEKVLANPEEVAKGATPIWQNAPEESIFDNFWETRVLAQWDFDADKNGNPTNDSSKIAYHKGELKLNDNGTFYFENLGNRSVYGRQVLSKANILTKEDSWINKFDFFDSDDIDKSWIGTTMKNVVSIVPMFIPYVGQVYVGAGIALEAASLGAVLGKMAVGSDSPGLNKVEGFIQSINQPNTSEYATNNTWSLENLINMAGDAFKFIYTQRWVFKNSPALFKGTLGLKKEEEQAAQLSKWTKEFTEDGLKRINNLTFATEAEKAQAIANNTIAAQARAQTMLENYINSYNKLGAEISRAYMATTIGADMYGEAKVQGLSDNEATAVTLGYMAGEWLLLKSDVANWVLPELKVPAQERKAIVRELLKREVASEETKLLANSKVEKVRWFNKLFNKGKNIVNTVYSSNKNAWAAAASSAIAEGTEEVTEEILRDLTTSTYNLYNWISGSTSPKMSSFDNVLDRYLMSFAGGVLGGAMYSSVDSFKYSKKIATMDYNTAIQKLVYMGRNNMLDKFLKEADKMTLGDKNLSYTTITKADGTIAYTHGTKEDNQNVVNHQALRNQVKIIQDILNAHGANVSDTTLMDIQTLKDVRFAILKNSQTVGMALQDFNTVMSNIVKLTSEINDLNSTKSKMERGETDKQQRTEGESNIVVKSREELEKALKEEIAKKDAFLSGELAPEYIGRSIFEMSFALNEAFIDGYFRNWAETKTGKKYTEIPENDLNRLQHEYREYCESARKDTIRGSYEVFKNASKEVSNLLENNLDTFKNMSSEEKVFESFGERRLNVLLESPEQFESNIDTWAKSSRNPYMEFFDAFSSEGEKNELRNIAQSDKDSSKVTPQIMEYLINFGRTKLPDVLTPIINQDFINPEVRSKIINLLDEVITGLNVDANNTMDPFIEEEYLNMADSFTELRRKIKDLPNTPIIKALNNFGEAFTGGNIHIEQLLDILNKQLSNSLKNISDFTTDSENIKMVDSAIQLIKMFRSGVLASERTPARVNNIYGYNMTMNELVKDLKLVEIDSDIASSIYQDLNTLLSKFTFFKKLIEFNSNQKLKEQSRVSINKDFIFYKRTKDLLNNIPSNWEGVEELKSEINQLNRLQELADAGSLDLNLEERTDLERGTLKMKDAIYGFFQKNKTNVDNVEELSKLISAKNFDIYADSNDILSAVSTSIDDNAYIWQLATWASVKASDFYTLYKNSITEDIAPIAPQELAVYTGYASIKNGNVFDKFVDAYKKSLIDDYDIYVNKAKEKGGSPIPKDLILEASFTPRYPRITLIEGIPGSGKTNGVYKSIVNLLKLDDNFDLKNVWAVNTNKDTANKLISDLKFSKNTKVTAMDKSLLMSTISPEWNEVKNSKGDVEVSKEFIHTNEKGETESTYKIQSLSDIPSVIFIDETSHYSSLDMDLLNRFAIKYGITILAAGDFDQAGLSGAAPDFYNGQDLILSLGRFQFIRTPKLGVSMRTANGQQSANIALIRTALNDITKSNFNGNVELPLRYYIDSESKNLYGTLVFHNPNLTSKIKDTITNMVNTLKEGEKIGYVYTDETSELYKLLTTEFSNHINLYKGSSAQGLEGQYFIIENRDSIDPRSSLYAFPADHYKNIYTGISRASQGCMLVLGTNYNDENVGIYNAAPDAYPIEEIFNPALIKKFSDERKQILDSIIEKGESVKYIPRTSQVKVEDTPESSIKNSDTLSTVEVTTKSYDGEEQKEIITNPGVIIRGEQEGKVDNSNDDSANLPKMELATEPVVVVTVQSKGGQSSSIVQNGKLESSEQLTLPIYTEQNHELGAVTNSDGSISKSVAADSRIDGINGLVKLGIFKGKPFESLGKEAQDVLEMIKSMAYYESDKGKLTQRIKNYLGIEGDTYITFALKSISRNQSFLNSTADYLRFGKDVEKESQYDNHGSGDRSSEGRYKFIEMIIGTKQRGDLLEVSLASLPNWMTLIKSSIVSDEIKDIYKRLNSTTAVGTADHNYQVSRALQQELRSKRNLSGAEILDKLIEVYNFTNNAIFYLGDADWTLAKNFITTGPVLTRGTKGADYKVAGFEYEGDWITLDAFTNESTKSVSDVYISASGIYTSADGVNHEIKRGHPFVLVSDRGLAKDNLTSEYIRQLENPTIPKRVKLYYIIPPKATVREYFDNIRLIKDGKTHDNIGNLLTNYRILESIIDNETVRDRADSIGHKDTLSTMTKLIESLKDIDEKYEPESKSNIVEKLKILNNPIEGETVTTKKGEAISANTAIQNFLFDLVFAENSTIRTSDINYNSEEKTNEMLSIIENTLTDHRITGINYHVSLLKDESNPFMIKADTVDGIHLKTLHGNKSFEVNGKLDTTQLVGNITPILDTIIGKMNFDKNGMGRSLDTLSYIKGNSSLEVIKSESKPSIKDNIISNKQVSSIVDEFISKNPDTTIEGLTRYLMSQGHVTIQNGKDIIIYGKDSRIEDSPIIKIEKNGEIVGNTQPILVILENNTRYEGNLYLESSTNNSKYQMDLIRQVTDTPSKPQPVDLTIPKNSEYDYIDLFTQINDGTFIEGSEFLMGLVSPKIDENIADTIKTALEEEGIVPLENGIYKSVDPDMKELVTEAYEQAKLAKPVDWHQTSEMLKAYKNILEYIMNIYDNADNGELMDNDCPVKITLTI